MGLRSVSAKKPSPKVAPVLMHVFRGNRRALDREEPIECLDIDALRSRVGDRAPAKPKLPREASFIRIDGPEARPTLPRRSWRDSVTGR